MNSIIAVKTRSGMEVKAKEMIWWFQKQKNEDQIKDIHALETFTEVVDEDTEDVSPHLTQNDIEQNELKKEISSEVSNLKKQLDVVHVEEKRASLRANVKELEQKKNKLKSKKIESVVKGYILVELEEGIDVLSNEMHALIKEVPCVQYVLDCLPVIEEELHDFINIIEEDLEPKVEFEAYSEPYSMIEKCKEIAKNKSNAIKDRFFSVLKKGKKDIVQMPLRTFKLICSSTNEHKWFSFTEFMNKITKESIVYGRQGL